MAASTYLVGPSELEQYGCPLATPANVIRASVLVDHYLRRPEGCIWLPDANGQPAFMASATPSLTLTSAQMIAPGDNVAFTLPNYLSDSDALIGETVVIDRLVATRVEACTVISQQNGRVILKRVAFAHDGSVTPITLEFGLAVTEEHSMPSKRSTARLAQWPVARLLSGIGRYGYGRRSDQFLGEFEDFNLLSSMAAFGGPPVWSPFDTPASSLNPNTGDLWVPVGGLLANYTDVKVRYIAGWSAASLPPPIKIATAAIISALDAAPMGPQIRRFNAGKTNIERFSESVLDHDIKATLRPYMANWMV